MPNLTYTVADFIPFTKIISGDVNSRFNDIKTLLNTTGLDSTNVQLHGLTRDRVGAGTANHVVINDSSGYLSSEATLALSRGGLGASFASLTGQAGKGIVVNAGETALSFGSPNVDRLTQAPAADVATLTAAASILANDAVCLDLDNNGNYRVFKCDATIATRKTNFLGFATAAATVTPQIQTFTLSADLVGGNIVTYKINGRSYSTTYGTSNDVTVTAIATQMATDPDVQSAAVTGSTPFRVITITGKGALPINITNASNTGAATITLVTTQSPVGQTVQIRSFGIMTGFSGLTAGYRYFLSTSGAITNSPTDGNPLLVGQALTTTILFVNVNVGYYQFGTPSIFVRAQGSTTIGNAAVADSEHFNFTSWAAGISSGFTAVCGSQLGEAAYVGYLWLIDGMNSSGAIVNSTYRYDKSSWASTTARGTAKQSGGIGVLGGNLIAGKGSTGTSYAGAVTNLDSWNNSSWSSAGTATSGKVCCSTFVQNSIIHFMNGVNSSGLTTDVHETYNGSSTGTSTTLGTATNGAGGSQSSNATKGIMNDGGTGSNTYEWNGAAWSGALAYGISLVNNNTNSVNVGGVSGFASGTNYAYMNGGLVSGSEVNNTRRYGGTSWAADTASTNSRGGGAGGVY